MVDCGCDFIQTPTGPKGDQGQAASTNNVVLANLSTVTLAASDTGSTVYFNNPTGVAVSLPASPDVGTYYNFIVRSALSSGNYSVAITSVSSGTSDNLEGYVIGLKDATAGTIFAASALGSSTSLTMNGSTTGGKVGTIFRAEYMATNKWFISGQTMGSGSLATPFN